LLIVLDTNVAVSGLLLADSFPGQIVEAVYAADLALLFDDRIAAEYANVLARPKFQIVPGDIDRFLMVLSYGVPVVAPPLPLTVPDPDDLKFIEVAVAGGADAIVTGNARHFRVAEGRLDLPVVSPRRMVEMLRIG
jgi:putative PIN family toxin of toxin-antitoxin system